MIIYNKEPNEVIDGIPRFVDDGYALNFGLQWNKFATIQLDSRNRTNQSQGRLERCIGTSIDKLHDLNVLEAGCGAARFTEHLVRSGANVHCFDLSSAVNANKQVIGDASNYQIAQASIYDIPYPDNVFDMVICLGVIQHTPDSEKSIRALWAKVKPGGRLVIDHYRFGLKGVLRLSNLYRKRVLKMDSETALKVTDKVVEKWFPLHWAFKEYTMFQHVLGMVSPVSFYYNKAYTSLTREQYFELAKLDTHDYLTDQYKHLKTISQIRTILNGLPGAGDVEAWKGGNGVEGRATKRA